MTPADVRRVRLHRRSGWRPDAVCADCLGPPTCPQLEDDLWRVLWSKHSPLAARRCNCDEWDKTPHKSRRKGRVRGGDIEHWGACDLVRDDRSQFLCLECAERRLGRRFHMVDLKPCMGNYHAAVEIVRHHTSLLGAASREFRVARGRGPVSVAERALVDARAAALLEGRDDDAPISQERPSHLDRVRDSAARAERVVGSLTPGTVHALCGWIMSDLGSPHARVEWTTDPPTLVVGLSGRDVSIAWPAVSQCDRLDEFVDGELSAERAEDFRKHVADCPRCDRVLGGRLAEMAVLSAAEIPLVRTRRERVRSMIRDAVVDASLGSPRPSVPELGDLVADRLVDALADFARLANFACTSEIEAGAISQRIETLARAEEVIDYVLGESGLGPEARARTRAAALARLTRD